MSAVVYIYIIMILYACIYIVRYKKMCIVMSRVGGEEIE